VMSAALPASEIMMPPYRIPKLVFVLHARGVARQISGSGSHETTFGSVRYGLPV
jgi:hypothetical protein